jgi:hypothetical protein
MNKIFALLLFILLGISVSSCITFQSDAATVDGQSQINTAVASTLQAYAQTQATVVLAPTMTPTSTSTPLSTPVYLPVDPLQPNYQGWSAYKNSSYFFSFFYPSDWTLTEIIGPDNTLAGHSIQITKTSNPAISFFINYRSLDETIQIHPTGVGSGEYVSRGSVAFLGQTLERVALVGENKDLGVYYRNAEPEIIRGNLAFVLMLNCACNPYDPFTLSAEDEQIVDWLIASITIGNP